MLDCAATSSAVLSDILDSINGIIFERSCKLSTFDKCENSMRNFADFKIQPLDRSFTLDVGNALVGDILTTERDKAPRNLDIKDLSYMKDVSFDELDDPTIGVILDARFAWTWTGLGQRFVFKRAAHSSENKIWLDIGWSCPRQVRFLSGSWNLPLGCPRGDTSTTN